MATADFKINSTLQATRGYDATTSEAITLTLENAPAVDVFSVVYSVVSSSDGAPALTLSPSTGIPTTPTGNVTFTMPGTGFHSYLIQCQVNAGKSTNNRGALVVNSDYTKQRVISIRGAVSNVRKTVPAETTQYEEDGWNPALNELAEAFENGAVGAVDTSEPILTDGAASSLSNERNIQSLASSLAFASSAAMPITVSRTDAATNTNVDVFQASLVSAGTAAAGLGPGVLFKTENGSGSQVDIGRAKFAWTDATAASEDSAFTVQVMNAGSLATAITVSRTAATVAALTGVGTRYVTADASGALGTAVGSFADETAPYLVNDTTATNTNDVPIQALASTLAFISSAAAPIAIRRDDASTNTVLDLLSLRRTSGGTAAAGIGGQVVFENEDAAGNVDTSGYISCRLTTATNGAEVSEIGLWTKTGGGSLTKNAYLTGAGTWTATALASDSIDTATATGGVLWPTTATAGTIGKASFTLTLKDLVVVQKDAIGAADSVGLNLDNTTASGSTEQRPPTFRQRGYGHKTGGGGSQVQCYGEISTNLVDGTSNPDVEQLFQYAQGVSTGTFGKWTTNIPGIGGIGLRTTGTIMVTSAGSGFRLEGSGNPGMAFTGGGDVQLKAPSTDVVIQTNSTDRLRFTNAGNQTSSLPAAGIWRREFGTAATRYVDYASVVFTSNSSGGYETALSYTLPDNCIAEVIVYGMAINTSTGDAAGYAKRRTVKRFAAGGATTVGSERDIGADNEDVVGYAFRTNVTGNTVYAEVDSDTAAAKWGIDMEVHITLTTA